MLELLQQAHGSPALGILLCGGGATCHMETPHHIYLLTELPTALHMPIIRPFWTQQESLHICSVRQWQPKEQSLKMLFMLH